MFIYGGDFINTVVTSREAILKTCRELVSANGLSSLTMRTVAAECNIALGSLYNYFPSKNDLIISAIESVWQDIFHTAQGCCSTAGFLDYVQWIFNSIREGALQYPHFFTAHSLSFANEEKGKARQMMKNYFLHMETGLSEALAKDSAVRKDAFSEAFTAADFVAFIMSSLLSLLMQQETSCFILAEMIRRTIY